MQNIDIINLDSILKFLKNGNNIDLFKIFAKKYDSINQLFQVENIYEKTQLVEEYILINNIFDEIIKIDNQNDYS